MERGQEVGQPGQAVQAALAAARRVILFRGVVERSPLLRALVALLEVCAAEGPPPTPAPAERHLWERAAALAQAMLAGPLARSDAAAGQSRDPGPAVAPWHAAVVQGLLADENPLSEAAARSRDADPRSLQGLPPALVAAASHDLRCLQGLASLSPEALEEAVRLREPSWPPGVLTGRWLCEVGSAGPWPEGATMVLRQLASLPNWDEALPDLVAYWRVAGSGPWGQYVAFRWDGLEGGAGGGLHPVRTPDPTRLEDLVGYEAAREAVVENTERLVSGRPAHHLLLYGPRGTGKSATVRALAHAFGARGLRLVELPLARVGELPRLLDLLRDRPQSFIILLDDLSLDPHDPATRELKVVMEGALEAWPENVRLYATSNRRHVVRESRTGSGFRQEDETNEQISLADRFGMTVHFEAADQELYLRIVEGLARKAGVQVLDGEPVAGGEIHAPRANGPVPGSPCARHSGPPWVVDRKTLAEEALRWALWNNDRSPRTAAQFVRDWVGRAGSPT